MGFQKVNEKKYIKESLLQLSILSDEEVKKQLIEIAKEVRNDNFPIYPFYKKETLENGQISEFKQIDTKDAEKLSYVIVGRMCSIVAKEAYRIVKSESLSKDILENIEPKKLEEEMNHSLNEFDKAFSKLEISSIYRSIYYEFRKDYFYMLRTRIENILLDRKMKQEETQNTILNKTFLKRISKKGAQ